MMGMSHVGDEVPQVDWATVVPHHPRTLRKPRVLVQDEKQCLLICIPITLVPSLTMHR